MCHLHKMFMDKWTTRPLHHTPAPGSQFHTFTASRKLCDTLMSWLLGTRQVSQVDSSKSCLFPVTLTDVLFDTIWLFARCHVESSFVHLSDGDNDQALCICVIWPWGSVRWACWSRSYTGVKVNNIKTVRHCVHNAYMKNSPEWLTR